ncbi:MAG: zinc ribbon domain-containing protein, partial [Candidatus Thermoplasmatota archaeon]
MPEEQVTCPVCGAENKQGAKFCSECGIKLAVAERIAGEAPEEPEAEMDQLLKELLEKAAAPEPEKDEENIDDLLDSLVVAEEVACPLCGAVLDPSLKVCPECGSEFLEKKAEAPAEEEIFALDLERELEKLATVMEEAAKPVPEVPAKPAPEVALKPPPIPVEVPVKPAPEVALKPAPIPVEVPVKPA